MQDLCSPPEAAVVVPKENEGVKRCLREKGTVKKKNAACATSSPEKKIRASKHSSSDVSGSPMADTSEEGNAPLAPGVSKSRHAARKGSSAHASGTDAKKIGSSKPKVVKQDEASAVEEEHPGVSADPAAPIPALEEKEEEGSASLSLINRSAIKNSLKRDYPELRISPEFFLTFSKNTQKRLKRAAESALATGRKTLSSLDEVS